jgi:hypothetical protein
MNTLDLLALEEHRLHEAVKAARGSIEEKAQQLAVDGVLEMYREVHREYVRLARTGNVEALRRAAHLQWIASLEPVAFTGLGDLELAACEDAVALLEQMCTADQVDPELRWMLPHYTFLADWWFDAASAPALASFCRNHLADMPTRPPPDFVSNGRGQLGRYWASISSR